MALTRERMEELMAEYNELKAVVYEIEHKYSLEVYEVDLGFPPSLGLEKLTFTPKTDEEIKSLVALQVEEKCAQKVASAEKSFKSAMASLQQQQLSAEEANRQKVEQIDADYVKQNNNLYHKATNANVKYSTLLKNALAEVEEAYVEALNLQKLHYEAQNEAFQQRADSNEQIYLEQMARIEQLRATLAQTIEETIRSKEEKAAQAVQKYNNTVDEKENKYQFSCKRATEYARQAERNRALAVARLYASIGESGVNLRKKTEKYNACIRTFYHFTKEEAYFLINFDGFLQVELSDYYSSFISWVENNLR